MIRNRNIIPLILLVVITVSSCFKEDDKVQPHDTGDVETGQIEMTSTYKYQAYYDLGTATAISSNLKDAWDLGFSASDTSSHIIMNSANYMWLLKTGKQGLFANVDTAGKTWSFDHSSLGIRGTAIGDWGTGDGSHTIGNGELFIIDRGIDEIGFSRGIMRVVFDSLASDTFFFRFAELNGSIEHHARVARDVVGNHACFSFDQGGKQVDIEPSREDWDLHFTQYTTTLFTNLGDPYPYILTGVLINPNSVMAVMDSLVDFEALTLQDASAYVLSTDQDVIGYEWKWFDFSAGTYIVFPQNIYIIQDTEGFLYKLRFVSFINEFGERGFPGFEFVRL